MALGVSGLSRFFEAIAPLLRHLPPETAHALTIRALSMGLVPRTCAPDDPILATEFLGLPLSNPVGLAAGFDKNAQAMDAMLRFGFGFVEIGTVTPLPQSGNPRPRLFRLVEDGAVINRLGFNGEGMARAVARLRKYRAKEAAPSGLVGVNIGKNRDTKDAANDYALGAEGMADLADYLVLNVSSPNTPGLRDLQAKEKLEDILARTEAVTAKTAMAKTPEKKTPLLLKVAPDLNAEARADIADLALAGRIDGLIIGNTTLSRPEHLQSPQRTETGGLSGLPLFPLATACLFDFYRLTEGRVPLIGTGGIASGKAAYEKIRAGASLVQLYTALIYKGPGLVQRIKADLARLLRRDGFAHVSEAIGAAHRDPK
ncbi:MAG: dihydroorotate dehydrogenase (quinone) [Rhodospirillaceae bacterium]|nr:MAG: dihydroorotate dehydrogenase (quinone) [Rhodospirillaceae bacterium]